MAEIDVGGAGDEVDSGSELAGGGVISSDKGANRGGVNSSSGANRGGVNSSSEANRGGARTGGDVEIQIAEIEVCIVGVRLIVVLSLLEVVLLVATEVLAVVAPGVTGEIEIQMAQMIDFERTLLINRRSRGRCEESWTLACDVVSE
ncbi:hypothetical protein Fot_31443 [Forsythia ovata]|uniref:Uncharacterized protein n=1 Tax=Forsythia ovata TaxID=205694 RepID=A0ABD1T4Z2_9LAMI